MVDSNQSSAKREQRRGQRLDIDKSGRPLIVPSFNLRVGANQGKTR